MIALSAVVAGDESIRRPLAPQPIENLGVLIAAGVVGFLGSELVALPHPGGPPDRLAALVADGLHARTDGFTSLAVVAGALGVMAGFPLADPIVGLVVTVAILIVLRAWPSTSTAASWTPSIRPGRHRAALTSVQGVIDIDDRRLRWIGHPLHAETALVVDPALTVVDAQAISTAAQHHLLHQVPKLATATIHVSPAGPAGDAHHAELQHHR